MKEKWLDVVGYEGYYKVSNLGRVKGLDRTIISKRGYKYRIKGRILSPGVNNHGYEIWRL